MADEEQSTENTIAEDKVVTKYKEAAKIVNDVVAQVKAKCVAGACVRDICKFGDNLLEEETSKIFKKSKDIKKGIAFPTCISVNNTICHYSPLDSDPSVDLQDGDLYKIDMGCHIDGFIAVVAETGVVGASKENPITGRKADVIMAAYQAQEAALRLLKGGNENYQVTDVISKVASEYNCTPIEGMLSHQLQKNVIDGAKAIIQNPSEAQRRDHEKCEFDVYEVYALDTLVSTGAGKGRDLDTRTTVFKKKDMLYNLKMKVSRQFLSEADTKHGLMSFNIRSFADEKKAKMGVVECLKHGVMEPFKVFYEKDGEFVAQFKRTVLLMPGGPMMITGLPFETDLYKSDNSVKDEEIKALLATDLTKKKKKKKAQSAAAVEDMLAAKES